MCHSPSLLAFFFFCVVWLVLFGWLLLLLLLLGRRIPSSMERESCSWKISLVWQAFYWFSSIFPSTSSFKHPSYKLTVKGRKPIYPFLIPIGYGRTGRGNRKINLKESKQRKREEKKLTKKGKGTKKMSTCLVKNERKITERKKEKFFQKLAGPSQPPRQPNHVCLKVQITFSTFKLSLNFRFSFCFECLNFLLSFGRTWLISFLVWVGFFGFDLEFCLTCGVFGWAFCNSEVFRNMVEGRVQSLKK